MNWHFVAAGVLLFGIGLIHSILGERLIFRRMRSGGLVPTDGGRVLREPHVRILWATWHLGTALGWGMAAVLCWMALPASRPAARSLVATSVIASMLASSALVLFGTRGKHPGWAGLLAVAILVGFGVYA